MGQGTLSLAGAGRSPQSLTAQRSAPQGALYSHNKQNAVLRNLDQGALPLAGVGGAHERKPLPQAIIRRQPKLFPTKQTVGLCSTAPAVKGGNAAYIPIISKSQTCALIAVGRSAGDSRNLFPTALFSFIRFRDREKLRSSQPCPFPFRGRVVFCPENLSVL